MISALGAGKSNGRTPATGVGARTASRDAAAALAATQVVARDARVAGATAGTHGTGCTGDRTLLAAWLARAWKRAGAGSCNARGAIVKAGGAARSPAAGRPRAAHPRPGGAAAALACAAEARRRAEQPGH